MPACRLCGKLTMPDSSLCTACLQKPHSTPEREMVGLVAARVQSAAGVLVGMVLCLMFGLGFLIVPVLMVIFQARFPRFCIGMIIGLWVTFLAFLVLLWRYPLIEG